jgi:hypothetical protein
MRGVLAAGPAKLLYFHFVVLRPTPRKGVILVFAVHAGEDVGDSFSHINSSAED